MGIVCYHTRAFERSKLLLNCALSLKEQLGNKRGKARIYGQLGLLAAAEGNREEAGKNLLEALAIFAEFQDKSSIEITVRNLARIYQATKDESLLEAIAGVFGISLEEAQQAVEST